MCYHTLACRVIHKCFHAYSKEALQETRRDVCSEARANFHLQPHRQVFVDEA